jgi:diaminopimelate decarboxylase
VEAKVALLSLTKREAKASFFFYDADGLLANLKSLHSPGVKLWYATKANPISAAISASVEAGLGIDCASLGEIRQALKNGAKPENLLLTGPAKGRALLEEAVGLGLRTFVVESVGQLRDLDSVCGARGLRVKALLRLQIPQVGGGASVLGGDRITVFGLGAEDWIRDWVQPSSVDVIGVHSFQWGNILDPERLKSIWTLVVKEAISLANALGIPLKVVDFGGGLGINYSLGAGLEWSQVSRVLQEVRLLAGEVELWLELGRYAVGEYGWYASPIEDRKRSLGQNFLALQGGSHHLLRPALVNESFPCEPAYPGQEKRMDFSIHGPLCTALDHLGNFSLPSDIGLGDYLVFAKCGAYGFTESMPYFLCHEGPEEWVWTNGRLKILRKAMKPEEWLV